MKDKWNTSIDQDQKFTGQPVGLLISPIIERWPHRSTVSQRAILNYNAVEVPLSQPLSPVLPPSAGHVNYAFSISNQEATRPSDAPEPTLAAGGGAGATDKTLVATSGVESVEGVTAETGAGTRGTIRGGVSASEGLTTGVSGSVSGSVSERVNGGLVAVGAGDKVMAYSVPGSPKLASRLAGDTTTLSSDRTEATGSTTKLVKYQSDVRWRCRSCWSWPGKVIRGISSVSLAAGLGTVARLPAAAALHGGAPFLAAYALLTVLLGAPLVFLELGVGQIVEQGVTRTWRAVPMFRGVGYIKLVVNMLLCVYYPLYIGLALFYLTWLAKGGIPFKECAGAKMTEEGYRTIGIPGEQCLSKTFLAPALDDTKWFGIYAAFLLAIWLIIMLCSFRQVKAYIRSMTCFFIPVFLCMVALLVKAICYQSEGNTLYDDIDWSILQSADVWYYATIQLFFSTHLGFGNVVTCAGKVYNKADPFWAAMAYMFVNILLGALSVVTCYILAGDSLRVAPGNASITELHLYNAIYDQAVIHQDNAQTWTVLAYFSLFLSGFISMLAVVFTILKAIRVETKNKCHWWRIAALFCFTFCVLGTLSILVPDFQVVHILDHYVVGNLLLICTILEVGAFVYIYGCSNLYIDFEFILGSRLTWLWKVLWWLAPVLLTAVGIWALATVRLTGLFRDDPVWMYATGWTIVVVCVLAILAVAGYEVYIQVDYNLLQKLSSALKPSRKWGPVDPMIRHGWIQWRSTAGTGDRDFTLKRRGTRDYTHSIKNRRHTLDLNSTARFVSTLNTNSDLTTVRGMSPPDYGTTLQNGGKRHTLEVVSITDTLERNDKPRIFSQKKYFSGDEKFAKHNVNPLGMPSMYVGDTTTNDSNSEGYGTIRNGPYVIANGEFDHVCWRKDMYEEATEL